MNGLLRALVATLAGPIVGFSIAFITNPDPTGMFPMILGLALSLVLVPGFYVGLGRAAATE